MIQGNDPQNAVSPGKRPDPVAPRELKWFQVRAAQRWIEADMMRGVLPPNVKNFTELHHYVDANTYLFDTCPKGAELSPLIWHSWSVHEMIDHATGICEALDAWLRSGRRGEASDYLRPET